jgi:hypothetical protein
VQRFVRCRPTTDAMGLPPPTEGSAA